MALAALPKLECRTGFAIAQPAAKRDIYSFHEVVERPQGDIIVRIWSCRRGWSRWRGAVQAAAVLLGMLGTAGCGFQPLYGSGTTTASGAKLPEIMAAVEIKPIPGRVGQRVRNELIFLNTGGGYAPKPTYELQIALRQSVISQLVQISGNAQGEVLELTATFKLVNLANKQVIYGGTTISRAPYNRYQEIFANVRAQNNAEDRAAGEVAESIKTQVAAFLARST
jgi:LPS-assembly lipoprotein